MGLASLILTVGWPGLSPAQTFDEQFEHWPLQPAIKGRILVDCGVTGTADIQPALNLLFTGNRVAVLGKPGAGGSAVLLEAAKKRVGDTGGLEEFTIPAAEREGLPERLGQYDVVMVPPTGEVDRLTDPQGPWPAALGRLVDQGQTLVVDARLATWLGKRVMPPAGTAGPSLPTVGGLNLLPDCILQIGPEPTGEPDRNLLAALALHPRCVGLQIEGPVLAMLSGRKWVCFGPGQVSAVLPGTRRVPVRFESIGPPTGRQDPGQFMLDLTEWRRDAIDRTLDPFPPQNPPPPRVENGSLLIVGGGGLPAGLMERFVELAGGKDNARLVYIPCSEAGQVDPRRSLVPVWRRMGVQRATLLHTKDRMQAHTDEEFMQPLKEATGIWFGGGRQWNFSDSWYGTRSHRLMKQVLQRGGVIGGSSAGASVQARYLARATPIGNFRIMAPGYERGGLGFIGGVAIDQHFTQRGRQPDMTSLVDRYPQLLGIGIDEGTALFVQQSRAEVLGDHTVCFYDRNLPRWPDRPDHIALPAGSIYDLVERRIIRDTRADEKEPGPDSGGDQGPAEAGGR